LEFKVGKSNSLWLDSTIVWGELNVFPYVVAFDGAVANLTKELSMSVTLCRITKFFSPRLDFILKLLQFTGTLVTRLARIFQLTKLHNEIRP
jgi:hypothetical protein